MIRGSSREERREGREVREARSREVREPLSKQLARNLRSSFNDDNRTPSPDNTMVHTYLKTLGCVWWVGLGWVTKGMLGGCSGYNYISK